MRIFLLILLFSSPAWAQLVNNGNFVTSTLAPTVRTLPTGASLNVTAAVIGSDPRYVNMGLQVQSSELLNLDTFILPISTNNTTGNTTLARIVPGGSVVATLRPAPPPPLNANFFRDADQHEDPSLDALFQPPSPGATVSGNNFWGDASSINSPLAPTVILFVDSDPRLLAKKCPALTEQLSLADAVKRLARATNSNIVFGSVGFRQAGLDLAANVPFNLPAATLRQSLARLLLAAAPNIPAVITAEDNVITITTLAQADRTVITRTYDAKTLMLNSPTWMETAARISPEFEESNFKPKNLLELVVSTVRPEIWKANGGKSGEIYQVNDHVTITAPATVHAILGTPALSAK